MKDNSPPKDYWILDILDIASEETEEGGVKGRLKMDKLAVLVRENLDEDVKGEWSIISDFRGPRDPGLTRLLQTYSDLDLTELEKMRDETILRKITKKGEKYFHSLDRFYQKISPRVAESKENIDKEVLEKDIDKTGEELVETDEIQELKDGALGEKM